MDFVLQTGVVTTQSVYKVVLFHHNTQCLISNILSYELVFQLIVWTCRDLSTRDHDQYHPIERVNATTYSRHCYIAYNSFATEIIKKLFKWAVSDKSSSASSHVRRRGNGLDIKMIEVQLLIIRFLSSADIFHMFLSICQTR